jgi:hypothetical protein
MEALKASLGRSKKRGPARPRRKRAA